MRKIEALFADYASHHRTAGNKWFHRVGIPLIVMTLLGMLSRVPLGSAGRVVFDAALALIVLAELFYFALDWKLAIAMLLASLALYAVGRALPMSVNVALFVLGWIFQFIGHSVYEKRQPAFFRNLTHLFVGPLWILNDVVPVVRTPTVEPQ